MPFVFIAVALVFGLCLLILELLPCFLLDVLHVDHQLTFFLCFLLLRLPVLLLLGRQKLLGPLGCLDGGKLFEVTYLRGGVLGTV